MSWVTQGRQDHGWFGSGTGSMGDTPLKGGKQPLFDPENVAARIDAMAYSAVAHMPRTDRARGGIAFGNAQLERLRTAVTAWMGARSLNQAVFSDRFIDPATSSAAIGKLRAAAEGARTATTHQELADASAELAGAMRDVGLDQWPRFLSDAAARARSSGKSVLAQLDAPRTATDAAPATSGGYVDPNPEQWVGHASVGDGECVALVRSASGANAPRSALWRPGALVQGSGNIARGTIIATFNSNGHYAGHTAIYLGQDQHGIQVIDQWNTRDPQGNFIRQHPPGERTLYYNSPRRDYVDQGENYRVVQ